MIFATMLVAFLCVICSFLAVAAVIETIRWIRQRQYPDAVFTAFAKLWAIAAFAFSGGLTISLLGGGA